MMLTLALLLAAHGLIHLLGFAKAFGVGRPSTIAQPISPLLGSSVARSRRFSFWLPRGAVRVATRLVGDWRLRDCRVDVRDRACLVRREVRDARPTSRRWSASSSASWLKGPLSLRAAYDATSIARSERAAPAAPITDADLAHLPDPVQRYLRVSRRRRPAARPQFSRPDARPDPKRPRRAMDCRSRPSSTTSSTNRRVSST